MIRMIKSELAKIWQGKAFWIIIFVAVIINLGYMQFGQQMNNLGSTWIGEQENDLEWEEVISPSAYKNLDTELAKQRDKDSFIQQYYEEVLGVV